MAHLTKPLTADQIKTNLRAQGITITKWASQHGYRREEVYRVLNGQSKAHYGKAHRIALALGLKRKAAQHA